MIRLYVPNLLSAGQNILLSEKQAHYLKHVMRIRENEEITVFNGRNGVFLSKAVYQGKKNVGLMVSQQIQSQKNLPPCGLAFALIKKENTDLILQKATELGVTDIFPLLTERTVVRQFNQERAKSIVIEAVEQCERSDVPTVHRLTDLKTFLAHIPEGFTPVYLAERVFTTEKLSAQLSPLFTIGPEGGFTNAESQFLQNMPGMRTLHLGETILRAETAAIAVLSAWNFRLF